MLILVLQGQVIFKKGNLKAIIYIHSPKLAKQLKNIFVRIAYLWFLVSFLCLGTLKAQNSSSYKLLYKQVDSTKLYITVYPSSKHQKKAPGPAIIFFHGGGWKAGTIKQLEPHAQYFAQRGAMGILVAYRVSSRNHTTPFDAVKDARDAIKFIIQHAKKLGIDSRKLVVSGGSAGGHLALISTFLPEENPNFKPAALVLFNPIINTGPNGYGYKRLGNAYKSIDPIIHIPANPPPALLFYGTRDQYVPEKQAKIFCCMYEANGGVCKVKFYKGQKHGFFNYKHRKYFIATVRQADKFLVKEDILEGKPNIKKWMRDRND